MTQRGYCLDSNGVSAGGVDESISPINTVRMMQRLLSRQASLFCNSCSGACKRALGLHGWVTLIYNFLQLEQNESTNT